jgi:hypothetical protein
MSEIAVQPSFSGGEWSPNLYARVDLAKFHSAVALATNFFVDYRGGISTRPGTAYVIQAYKSSTPVRVIPFQASFNVGYAVEIGNGYMRFHYHGAPVLEATKAITAATKANPCVVTSNAHGYAVGDWVYITGVVGMTQLNNRFFQISAVTANTFTLGYLSSGAIDSTAYSTYTSGGTVARIYTIASPYTSADNLRLIKFAQNVNQMILCHPNYPVYALTLITANNWTMAPAVFGSTIAVPAAPTITTSLGAGGNCYYSYVVTSIDSTGQESSASSPGTLSNKNDIRTNAQTNTITWTAVPGAVGYNVYEAALVNGAAVVVGAPYGFIGTTTAISFTDSNIAENFSLTPPVTQNPFTGYSVASVTVGTGGQYNGGTSFPTVSFTGSSSTPALGTPVLKVLGFVGGSGGTNYAVNDVITCTGGYTIKVLSLTGSAVNTFTVTNAGAWTAGTLPATVSQVSTTGSGTGFNITNVQWYVSSVTMSNGGSGYSSAPSVVFSAGAVTAAGTAVLSANPINPTVPGFTQQRLTLAAPSQNPSTFWMSQPGQYFNFNVNVPVQPSNAITATLVTNTLNTIKSIVGSAAGMLVLTDKAVFLVNGGSYSSPATATNISANPQSYIGASDVPPIVANYDILFVQSKGSAVRAMTYSIYAQVFTGNDVSVLSSHLFYGYTIQEWCWAEQPFYSVQAVRSDGQLLTMTYMKDQEYIGWTHYTTNGLYNSICSVTEILSSGVAVDAVYTVTQRTVGGASLQYIERFAERAFPAGYNSAWCVDAGLQYSGAPATSFTGAEHLAGLTVTGLADGVVITPFTMPSTGFFTLGVAASTVTVGLAYTCQLQTLPLDVGDPSVQGKVKKIQGVDIRVVSALGLTVGSSFSTLVPVKDLVINNVSSALTGQPSQTITDLITGDAYNILDPTYTVPGQFCFQQSQPFPATIVGIFPRFVREVKK